MLRRRRTSRPRLKHYAAIIVACAVVALVMHFVAGARKQAQDYVEERAGEIAREAAREVVRDGVSEASRER